MQPIRAIRFTGNLSIYLEYDPSHDSFKVVFASGVNHLTTIDGIEISLEIEEDPEELFDAVARAALEYLGGGGHLHETVTLNMAEEVVLFREPTLVDFPWAWWDHVPSE